MILHTTRTQEVVQWVEGNCAEPSSYTVCTAWKADFKNDDPKSPQKITLKLSPVDQMLFDINFAGCFVKDHGKNCWYDASSINALMIRVRAGNT